MQAGGEAGPFRLTGHFDGGSPILLSAPHSGTAVPATFHTQLPHDLLRRIEDAHVGDLARPSTALGIPLLEATWARAVIDLNRAETEFDPAMIAGDPPWPARATDRVRAGYGLFPRIVAAGKIIRKTPMEPAEMLQRVEHIHRPYHAALAQGMATAHARHGVALLVDCHSMPRLDRRQHADIVLGDRWGGSAAGVFTFFLQRALARRGWKVARNRPYAGGHIVERHGRPAAGMHGVQIEFDRSLYMNPETLEPNPGLERLGDDLRAVLGELLRALPDLRPALGPVLPLAAE